MRKHVLVLIHEIESRARLARLLAASAYKVELSDCVAHARRLLAERTVSLVIVDPRGMGPEAQDFLGECRAVVGPTLVVGTPDAADCIDPDDAQATLRKVAQALVLAPDVPPPAEPCLTFAGFTLDPAACVLHGSDGGEVALTRSELALLRAFVRGSNRALSRDALTQAVAGRDSETFDRGIDMLVSRLRRKIEADPKQPRLIVTVPGVGYRLAVRPVVVPPMVPATAADDSPPPKSSLPVPTTASRHRLLTRRGLGRLALPVAGAFGIAGAAAIVASRRRHQVRAEVLPGLVVLPFASPALGAEEDYFGTGLADEITYVLATYPGFRVLTRPTLAAGTEREWRLAAGAVGAEYVLGGTAAKLADRVRVTATLTGVADGEKIWASRFEGEGADIMAMQSDIADKVFQSLAGFRGQMDQTFERASWLRAPVDLGEYDFYLRGYRYFWNFTESDNARARDIWRQGLERYPRSGLLLNKIGWTYVNDLEFFWSDNFPRDIARAWDFGRAAETAAGDQPKLVTWLNRLIMASLNGWHGHDFDRMIRSAEASLQLVPYDTYSHGILAYYVANAGSHDRAVELAEWALRRDPHGSPQIPLYLSWAHYLAGRYEVAMQVLGENNFYPPQRAAILLRVGRADEARATMAAYVPATLHDTLANEGLLPLREPSRQRWLDDLRHCGMPEA